MSLFKKSTYVLLVLTCLSAVLTPTLAQSLTECARLSDLAYYPKKQSPPSGWKLIADTIVKKWGFQGSAFYNVKDKELVIAFAGTQLDDPKDILADLGIASGEIEKHALLISKATASIFQPKKASSSASEKVKVKGGKETQKQVEEARRFYSRVLNLGKLKNLKYSKMVVGHSLGGFLAQVIAAENGVKAKTFNAPGAAAFTTKRSSSITNYVRNFDMVGGFGIHIGTKVVYPGVQFEPLNYKERYVIRNHSMTEFYSDLKKGLKPM